MFLHGQNQVVKKLSKTGFGPSQMMTPKSGQKMDKESQMGPCRPNFKSYSHITALQPVGTVPGPFRPTFGLPGQPAGQPVGQLAGQLVGQLSVQLAGQLPVLVAGQLTVQLVGQLADQLAVS